MTGATGKVGNAVARALAERGDEVRVLARSPDKARAVLPDGVEVVRGDVTEPESVAAAVAGVDVVFNAVGLPEQWTSDPDIFDRVNARGSETVARAARVLTLTVQVAMIANSIWGLPLRNISTMAAAFT